MQADTILDFATLLRPISGGHPAGPSLREQGSRLYIALKTARKLQEARDLGLADGVRADWQSIASAACELLTEYSKDLEIASWLTHALTKTRGATGLRDGIRLIRGLLENFWEDLHPEPDLRFGHLDWLGHRMMTSAVLSIPLTEQIDGQSYSWYRWDESRRVARLGDPGQLNAAIAEGKINAEQFDQIADKTPQKFYQRLHCELDAAKLEVTLLTTLLERRMPDEEIRLHALIDAIDRCKSVVDLRCPQPIQLPQSESPADIPMSRHGLDGDELCPATLLASARQTGDVFVSYECPAGGLQVPTPSVPESGPDDTDECTVEVTLDEEPTSAAHDIAQNESELPAPLTEVVTERIGNSGASTTNSDSASLTLPLNVVTDTTSPPASPASDFNGVPQLSAALRRVDPTSPWPYLLLRAARWGLLRQYGRHSDQWLSVPAPAQRFQLSSLYSQGRWSVLLEAAEELFGAIDCGRWLEPHFYTYQALSHLGPEFGSAASAVKSATSTFIRDLELSSAILLTDGTPCASPETWAWLVGKRDESDLSTAPIIESWVPETPRTAIEPEQDNAPVGAPRSSIASPQLDRCQTPRSHSPHALIRLQRAASSSSHGRERFVRHLEIVEHCLSTSRYDLARPILEQLMSQSLQRDLDGWEDPSLSARLWSSVLECHCSTENAAFRDPALANTAFERLCLIDVTCALKYLNLELQGESHV